MFFWFAFGIPLVTAAFSWVFVLTHWSSETHQPVVLTAMLAITAMTLYPLGAFGYVRKFGPMPAFDVRLEGWGMLISLCAIVCTVIWLRKARRLVALFLLAVSAWWLLVWFFMASIAF
jgi:hypothetical protein